MKTEYEEVCVIIEWAVGIGIGLVIGAAIASFISFRIGYNRRKSDAEAEIGSAEQESRRIVNDALKVAESKKREALLEAKEEFMKQN